MNLLFSNTSKNIKEKENDDKEVGEIEILVMNKAPSQEPPTKVIAESVPNTTASNPILDKDDTPVFQVSQMYYNKEGIVDYQTDNIFEVGTEEERYSKAIKFIRVTCQQMLYSTMVMYPDGGHLKNRFEIFLYKKEASKLDVLKKITRSNLEAFLQSTK
jgi:hypothetical protein